MARRAAYIKALREEGRSVLVLDAGDSFFPGPKASERIRDAWIRKADVVRAALHEMQYDAINVGDYDLAAGASYLLDGAEGLALLSSNLAAPDSVEPLFQPYIVRDIDGLRVGIIGLLDPQRMRTNTEVVVNDPVERAAEIVAKVRKKCDLLIALSHLESKTEKRLLEDVPEIDILVSGGHTGPTLNKPQHRGRPVATKEDSEEHLNLPGRTVALRTATKGASLGRLDLMVAPGFEALYDSSEAGGDEEDIGYYHNLLISLDEEIDEDPRIKELISEYKKSKSKQAAVGPAQKVRVYLGAARCRRCHTDQYAAWKDGPHARAYERLVKDGHGRDSACIECHSTGYRKRGGFWEVVQGPRRLGGVQCEACHGPGGVHVEQQGKGYISKTVSSQLCLACHTSERDKTFDLQADLKRVHCPPSGASHAGF